MKAINTINDHTWEFDKSTTPEWAVRYAWADENGFLSVLLDFQHDNRQDLIALHFPIIEGKKTVMMGDIGAFKRIN
jgi:hypothetical protein